MCSSQTNSNIIRVLIVDDHELVRKGLHDILETVSTVKVVGEAKNGEEAIRIAKETDPHVIFMDVKMPTVDGIEATARIKRLLPDVEILVISSYDDGPVPAKILQAGAKGYITKGAARDEILFALNKVRNHQTYVNSKLAQKLAARSISPNQKTPFDLLSERELQVAQQITMCKKAQQIAKELGLSPKTVNSYRYRVFSKLQISSDIELTQIAIQYGLVEQK